jgi:hypothetical protein
MLTHAPAQLSTVVDHVPAASCVDESSAALGADQRGLGRPFDGDGIGAADCDAGAVELQAAPPVTPPAGGGSTPATPKPVKCPKGKKLKKGKCVKKKKRKK